MRQAIRQNRARQQTGRTVTLPAPVRGWNARDGLSEMRPDDAVRLVNYFPDATYVGLRRGYVQHADGITGNVDTLMGYAKGGTVKLLAAGNGGIYDATASGMVGAALGSGYTSNRWQHVNFGDYLIAVNGADDPVNYNGTAIATTPAITGTGLTASNLITVTEHKQRLWFAERDTLNAWYLPVLAIGGAAVKFNLAGLCRKGGTLQAIAPWTVDAGAGADDMLVFITSEGEYIVYQGSDPSNAATWGMIGRFEGPRPIGRRCTCKMGGELLVLTEAGILPLSKLLVSDSALSRKISVTDRIDKAFTDAASLHGGNFGWQAIVHADANMLICNVPVSATSIQQYVMNALTGAWCSFTGMNARCWAVVDGVLYFGGTNGRVYQAWTGSSDAGAVIPGDVQTSFQYVGGRTNKLFTLMRPQIVTDGAIQPAMALLTDFEERVPSNVPNTVTSQSQWDTAVWDQSLWGGEQALSQWTGAGGIGQACALRMRTSSRGTVIKLVAFDVVFERGGVL